MTSKPIACAGAGIALVTVTIISTYSLELSPNTSRPTGRSLQDVPIFNDPWVPQDRDVITPNPGSNAYQDVPSDPNGSVGKGSFNFNVSIFLFFYLSSSQHVVHYFTQVLFGVLFYFIVVKKYALVEAPTEMSGEVMRKNAVTETCDECCKPVCWFSYCCPVPRWALTLHATDAMNYWVALAVSFVGLFPCLMCFAMAFSDDLNQKLGGTKDACCKACLCAFFCSCCVNVKYAVALDFATNQKLGCCSIVNSAREITTTERQDFELVHQRA